MKFIQSLIILLLVSCSEVPKVTIIKQWHLAPGQKTQNVQASMKLPQFVNQKDIYEYLEKKGSSSITVIAEGCEGEVDTSFNETFNGWTMDELIKQKDQIHFKDIMAPVWMKLKAKNPKKYNVVCGDNLQDIERNKLAMSDLRGFVGFYERLKASSAKPSAFNMYAKSLSELERRKITNPLEFSRKAALDSLKESRDLIEKRNLSFLEIIKKNIDSNPYVVIGGIHAQHLTDLLKEQGIAFNVVEPKGYSSKDHELYKLLEDRLTKDIKKFEVIWLEVPNGFSAKTIAQKNFLKSQEIAHPKEWIELSTLMEQVSLDPKILLSDFDGDGIRDFTLSTSGAQLVLSAEDDDWDNDGTPNLIDKDWGNHKFEIEKVTAKTITNKFDVRGVEASDLLKNLDEMNIDLIPDRELKHDLLLLNVIQNTLKYAGIKKGKLRFIRLSKAKVQYGKKVYFAFNPASLTIDIYQEALFKHFNEVHSKYYSKSSVEDVLKGYLLPLLYHSLAHELVHAMDLPVREMAKNDGWTFDLQNTGSKYLKNNRLDRKKISELMNNTRYKAHTPDEWVALYRKAGKGFLVKEGLPSFYALQKPSEWVAEKVSMCFLRRVFPNSVTAKGSAGYEALLGVNPSSVTKEFCSNYFANVK